MIEVVRHFLQMDPAAQQAIAQQVPPECAEGVLDDCIRAVCQQDYPKSYTAKHRPPFFDAVLKTRSMGGNAWSTMRGAMTYHVVSEMRAIFCNPPPPAALALVAVAAHQVVKTTPKSASGCAPAAMASHESGWTILGEFALGVLIYVGLRGVPARAILHSGTGGFAPSNDAFRNDSGA